ncbi:MAG TPA: DUF6247 family protein [Pseudonocardiaceae bacterium]|nr:DUF6247 family protein [Pseudonocardiaceae bacterium]
MTNAAAVAVVATAENVRSVGYRVNVTAEPVQPFFTPAQILPPELSPTAIRDALIDEEREEFLRAYHEAIAEADRTIDLTRVLEVLTNYQRIAWLTKHQGVEVHRRMLDQVAHAQRTGEAPPGSVGAAEMRALLRKRLAR